MTTIKERIAIALDRSAKSQRDLAKAMGLSAPTVSAMLAKDEIDSIKYLRAVEELTGYRFEWLRTGAGPEKTDNMLDGNLEQSPAYWKELLKNKDDLNASLKETIAEMKKYQKILEEQLKKRKG